MTVPVDLLRKLRDGADASKISYYDWGATRVGRNSVWKIHRLSTIYFVKVWTDPAAYRRELFGLQMAEHLASGSPGFLAARVEAAHEELGCIVTHPIAGRSIGEILREAYRIDKNAFRRRERIESAHRAVLAAVNWLSSLHSCSTRFPEFLYDHTTGALASRMSSKLASPCHGMPLHQWLGVSDVAAIRYDHDTQKPESHQHLVFGDPSLSNFFFDGSAAGAVDFEDLGYGQPQVDFELLRYWLSSAMANWHYRSDATLLDRVPSFTGHEAVKINLAYRLLQDFEQAIVRGRSWRRNRIADQLRALCVSSASPDTQSPAT